jgi:hypothetical protein
VSEWEDITDPKVLKVLGVGAPPAPAKSGGGGGWEDVTDPGVLKVLGVNSQGGLGRTAGLAVRAGVQAAPNAILGLPGLAVDAARSGVQGLRYAGQKAGYALGVPGVRDPRTEDFFPHGLTPTGDALSAAGKMGADAIGLPQPETRGERIAVAAGQAAGEAFGGGGAARIAGKLLPAGSRAATGASILGESLPTQTVAGAAAGGAGQALAEGGSTPMQQAAGSVVAGVAGGLGAGAAKVATNAAVGAFAPLTSGGRDTAVGRFLRAHAADPDAAIRNTKDYYAAGGSPIPEVNPTVAGASLDPGLASMESGLRNLGEPAGRYSERILANNRARNSFLDDNMGTPQDVDVLKRARDITALGDRSNAFSGAQPAYTDPILRMMDSIAQSPEGTRTAVKRALDEFRPRVTPGQMDPRVLYELRKDIDVAMNPGRGFGNTDHSDIKLARRELVKIKQEIDNALANATGGRFETYLDNYKAASRSIGNQETLIDIRKDARASQQPDILPGGYTVDLLGPGQLRKAIERRAPEFQKLYPFQQEMVQKVLSDLQRSNRSNTTGIKAPGSDTMRNLSVAAALGRAFGQANMDNSTLRYLVQPLRPLYGIADIENKIAHLVVDAILDPQRASILMEKATPKNMRRVSEQLMAGALRATAGTVAGGDVRVDPGQ